MSRIHTLQHNGTSPSILYDRRARDRIILYHRGEAELVALFTTQPNWLYAPYCTIAEHVVVWCDTLPVHYRME